MRREHEADALFSKQYQSFLLKLHKITKNH